MFLLSKIENIDYDIIYNYTKIDKRIKLIRMNDLSNDSFDFIFQLKGKFISLINKFEILQRDDLEKFYNSTKGKINYIFKFNTSKGNYFYLIKDRILKDIIDKDLKFKTFTDIINYINLIPNPKLNYISIALFPDNFITPYTYVAMLSILNSKFVFTYITFYLIISEDFEIKNINFLLSLYDQFDLFNITFLKIDNRYKTAYIRKYLRNKTYLSFSLGKLIPYLNKIIFLDTDIIAYKDLTEFYQLNFKGKIILAQPTFLNKNSKTRVYKINNGVLLLNLKKMRKLQIEKKILYILNNQFQNEYHAQFLYNQYLYKLIGFFPAKYYIGLWNNNKEINIFNKNSGNDFDNDYLFFSLKYPFIVLSAFNSKTYFGNISISEDWWYLARISKYYKQKTENISIIFNYTYI